MATVEKAQQRAYRALGGMLPVLEEYVITEGTGARVLASLDDLRQRRGLTQRACVAGSDDASRLLGPLACFAGLAQRLDARHAELQVAARNNVETVLAALQQLHDRISTMHEEMEEEVASRCPAFSSEQRAAATPDLPWSINACLEAAQSCRACLGYDLLVKLDAAAQLRSLLPPQQPATPYSDPLQPSSGSGEDDNRGPDSTAANEAAAQATLQEALERWPSPALKLYYTAAGEEKGPDPDAAAADNDADAHGDAHGPSAEFSARTQHWAAVNDVSRRLGGGPLGLPRSPSANGATAGGAGSPAARRR